MHGATRDTPQAEIAPIPERRAFQRFAVLIPGRYSLSDGVDRSCVTENISSEGVALRSLVRPPVSAEITCDLRAVGRLVGRCRRHTESGFVLSIRSASAPLNLVASRLREIASQQAATATSIRVAERFVPKNTRTTISLSDGTCLEASIVNVSQTGVALSAETRPAVDTIVVVGRMPARIVRHFDAGIGATFLRPLPVDQVSADLVL